MRSSPRNLRVAVGALLGVVILAGIGWAAGSQIRSPAQTAADAAPPKPSLISVPVERRALASEVLGRGTVRFGAPQSVVLPASSLKLGTIVVSRAPRRGARLAEGMIVMAVSGRPVFVFRGAVPMYRDLGPGDEGQDVRQLEQALVRSGLAPGTVDGHYDGATAAAVAAFYRGNEQVPFGVTSAQAERLSTAEATAAASREALLQTQVVLRTAQRGATRAEINQAQLDMTAADEAVAAARAAIALAKDRAREALASARVDAATADEAVPTARVAIAAASERIGAARDVAIGAGLQLADAQAISRRELAAAEAELVRKRAGVSDAIEAQAEAQRRVNGAPPETTAAELESLRAAVRSAIVAVDVARADVTAAEAALEAARVSGERAIAAAEAERRRAARELQLATEELRQGQATLAIAERKQTLAHDRVRVMRGLYRSNEELRQARSTLAIAERRRRLADDRVRILSRPSDAALERQVVESAAAEARRTAADAARIAARTGVQVPADEILFFPSLPLRVDQVKAKRGSVAAGSVMTVSNSRLAVDSSLAPTDAKLVRVGQRARIENLDLGVTATGIVTRIAGRPGTGGADPGRHYLEVTPGQAPVSLVGTSVKLSLSVKSTKGKVLAVPLGALSLGADGNSRVQLELGEGRTRRVVVIPGLAAQGFVEVRPARRGALRVGDLVVVGSGAASAREELAGVAASGASGAG
jgi:peptidoglycan hydrolase-like protein with peptidoglycan-binding domain